MTHPPHPLPGSALPPFRLAPRTPALASHIGLPLADQGPGFARFRPFGDPRVVLFLRGEGPRNGIPPEPTPFWSLVGTAPVGPFVIEVLRNRQVLSPPAWQPGMPPIDPQDYESVDDVLLLPDGELRIPRSPRGFGDHEIGFIVQSIQVVSTMPQGGAHPSHRDYLPQGSPAAEPPRAAEPRAAPMNVGGPPAPAMGCDVVLEASTFNVPPRCASCGAPQETTLNASRAVSGGYRRTVRRTFAIPYCNACAARVRGTRRKAVVLGFAALGVSLATAALSFAAPGLPFAVLVGLPIVVSVGFGIAAMTRLAPKPPAAPAVAAGDAVRLVSFKGNQSVLYCANPLWGQAFAEANRARAMQRNRPARFGVAALWIALIVAPIAAVSVWIPTHPQVHVDNAGPEALQIWLDGSPSIVVPPSDGQKEPPSIWIGYGQHMLGYSKVGATRPDATVSAPLTMSDDFLYNPQQTGCYWLVANAYGSASVAGVAQGPQAIKEFYSFDNVSTWFGDNPQSVKVSKGQSGDTRVALQRAQACMDLARLGCSDAVRAEFVRCQQAAKSDEAFQQCDRTVSCARQEPAAPASPAARASTTPHEPHPATEPREARPPPAHSAHGPSPAASASAKHG
jgi:hypothetical protein